MSETFISVDVTADIDTQVVDVVYASIPQVALVEVFAGGPEGPPGAPGADGRALAFVGPAPPPSPTEGVLWWDSFDTLELYVWYDDGTSAQWVVANTAQGGGPATLPDPFIFDCGVY